ncbi:hypothetical protein NQ314_004668 [Rhamnusium bicolor]|uniref:SET domain-containing protein n=1 Tax=Rhamnusium bicolor TaxID=1586634 RepID=A0AAV8ZM06_9CUCU|nr:hypothetical protein NQ314_004668 [Rhamnusium bicolor]
MDCLLAYYTEKFTKIDGNIFEVFSKFYSLDLSPVDSWLESQFKNKVKKDDHLSTFYRQEGNKCYARKDLLKSLEFYTKSLCCATPSGREYGLALANRSAVSFEMKEFENCLKDIDLCFNTDYPMDLKPKIYFRKAECYFETGQKENLEKSVTETYKFLSSTNVVDKVRIHCVTTRKVFDTIMEKQIASASHSSGVLDKNQHDLLSHRNDTMRYDKIRGRHVLAKKQIQKGDVLFIEKAFIFAPVFKENKEFYSFKCYNCLKDIISSIPELNLASEPLKGNYEEDLKHFGDKNDNYPYFNRLVSNIYKSKNAAPYIVMSAIVVTYLKKYTDFFTWFLKQKNCPKNDLNILVKYVGGLITKHIAQLSCNSSIIEHWTYSSTDLLFPDILITIACGMFPSVSIMNHSCRPNVTNFFICDTIIVKALEDISENDEVFNCYGIDYRGMNRKQRQIACRSLYHFECKCVICIDPSKEVDMLDSYLCPKCKGLVPEMPNTALSFCVNCGDNYSLKPFRKINDEAQKYLENDDVNQLELLIKSLKIRGEKFYTNITKILKKYTIDYIVIMSKRVSIMKRMHSMHSV